MNSFSRSFKIAGLSVVLLLFLVSPVFFFDFHSSLEQPEPLENLMQDQTYLRAKKSLDTEERDEDPRVFYLPDHKEGFASWLNEEIELPGLELPNLEIPEAEFYPEEDFPEPLNSLYEDLETKMRREWPLPELEENNKALELKTSSGQLLVFRGDEDMTVLIDDDKLLELFNDITIEEINGPSVLKVTISDNEMDIDLAQSCGVSDLDNSYARYILKEFYKKRITEEITKTRANKIVERSDFYIIEWRLAFKRLKSQ